MLIIVFGYDELTLYGDDCEDDSGDDELVIIFQIYSWTIQPQPKN